MPDELERDTAKQSIGCGIALIVLALIWIAQVVGSFVSGEAWKFKPLTLVPELLTLVLAVGEIVFAVRMIKEGRKGRG